MPDNNNATTGFGGKFEIEVAETWTEVKKIQTLEFDGFTSDFDEVTNLNSPNALKQWAPTTIDPGTGTVSLVADQVDPGQLALAAGQLARTKFPCRVTYPAPVGYTSGIVRTFSAWVQKNGLSNLSTTAASKYSVQLKIDGTITDVAAVAEA